jgi:hypothetical protein
VGGAACGPGIDFVQYTNQPFTISPNTPAADLYFGVTICGDTTIEPDETVLVNVTNLNGANCISSDHCQAIGVIVNDDGPPSMSVNNISLSTPQGLRRTVNFTVSLHHSPPSQVTVHYATRNGTASAVSLTGIGGYFATSGTIIFPANTQTLTASIPVQITANQSGTFFVDLSDPVGGTIFDGTMYDFYLQADDREF